MNSSSLCKVFPFFICFQSKSDDDTKKGAVTVDLYISFHEQDSMSTLMLQQEQQ